MYLFNNNLHPRILASGQGRGVTQYKNLVTVIRYSYIIKQIIQITVTFCKTWEYYQDYICLISN